MAFEPQSAVQLLTIPFRPEERVAAGDSQEVPLLAVPVGANFRVEVLRIGVVAEVLAVPDAGDIDLDIEFWDSLLGGAALATAVEAFSLTDYSADRTFDADTAVEAEVANVLGTLVADLGTYGLNFPSAYTITNLTDDRVLDCNSTTDAELADVLGTLINDLLAGSLGYYALTNVTTDRDADMSGPPANAVFADILATLIQDLAPRTDLTLNSTNSNLEDIVIRQYNPLFTGSQIMESGDTLNAEIGAHTATTEGEGYGFIVEYKVLQHS